MRQPVQPPASGFYGLGIAPGILEILAQLRYATPTPIQRQAIPIAMQGKDVVGVAQTGTGKTLAFGIPMIQILARTKGRGLVLVPTRELALQVDEMLHAVGRSLGLRTAVLIGGASMKPQIQAIGKNPHIIVATPGRLIDHLNQKTVTLGNVHMLVLDEADRMLDMGFLPQVQKILQAVPKDRQTMLFSATLSPAIMRVATANMKLPVRIEIAPSGTTVERVTQELFIVKREAKNRLLEIILTEHTGSALVFTRTKYGAKRVTKAVRAMSHSAAEIHSNRSLGQRRDALDGFKSGKYRVLVATDIAARGIDVQGIELVLNYDLPAHSEDYVHRIGRTARAGAEGHAISFVLPEEQREVRSIERLIRKSLPVSKLPELPPARTHHPLQRPIHRVSRTRFGGHPHHRGAPPTGVGGTSYFGGGAEPRTEGLRTNHSSTGPLRPRSEASRRRWPCGALGKS
ncbi:DEAD/DEAH box helicase [Candidatus Parcubacteria bacterium]|nr:DEAD/DEAH box helicase [Candidatus Parcubacteria bacterium]